MLTVTLSIRNIDPDLPLTLETVDYHGTEGTLLKHYLNKPLAHISESRIGFKFQGVRDKQTKGVIGEFGLTKSGYAQILLPIDILTFFR